MNVVIVESPAKAKTINKYLGRGLRRLSPRIGHVRDLPPKDGSVEPDDDFAMRLGGRRQGAPSALNEIAERGQGRRQAHPRHRPRPRGRGHLLARARDPARQEGAQGQARSSGWCSTPSPRTPSPRRCAIRARSTRRWSTPICARRALDYLVGFTLSPVLWRKLPGARSAGRVQSVALRLVCDRELEIEKFVAQEYWSIVAHLKTERRRALHGAPRRRRRQEARHASTSARARRPRTSRRRSKPRRFTVARGRGQAGQAPPLRRPSPPRRCSRRPRASSASRRRAPCSSPSASMKASTSAARRVGLITYMRTDGVDMAPEAVASRAQGHRQGLSATRYVPAAPRNYTTKAKNAQEAHEAIRPTDVDAPPERRRAPSRARPGAALRADLEAHRRQPDGERRARAHHRRHRRRGGRAPARAARHRPGRALRRLPRSSTRKAATTTRTRMAAACRR